MRSRLHYAKVAGIQGELTGYLRARDTSQHPGPPWIIKHDAMIEADKFTRAQVIQDC